MAKTAIDPAELQAAIAARYDMLRLAGAEVDRAYDKHGRDQWGRHEFYGVLKEEVDEIWDCIKQNRPSADLVLEMAQVVAMILRYAETGNRYGGGL